MPKGGAELVAARREEIINACETLYQTKGFQEITLKEIAAITSFTRTSIYNYFQTKEEIFLALLQREYEEWIDELRTMQKTVSLMTRDAFAQALAHSLEHRQQLLKILSMNHYDMESGSRKENLVQFKIVYGESLRVICGCLTQYFPEMTVEERQNFLYLFFPFLFGIYPYTTVNDKQREAMQEAGIPYVDQSVYELTYRCVCQLLGA